MKSRLPHDPDAEAVMAIGRYLDAHAHKSPVSITGALAVIRDEVPTLSEERLRELFVEVCLTRRLTVLFA